MEASAGAQRVIGEGRAKGVSQLKTPVRALDVLEPRDCRLYRKEQLFFRGGLLMSVYEIVASEIIRKNASSSLKPIQNCLVTITAHYSVVGSYGY